ncbi:hypothetical protein IG626_12420 [Desulfovibrio desulfuricans]|uniref:hypothetical protein n=1 Tax=Desulfovibrio desulfuricans TaxID=876 RepID=UPI001786A3A3|nr:hypothetical protein [Desulfovibrio desulfuricans]MBD8896800.1 hypothetical protein [Desulfovibrio desulfuricans]
MPEGKNPQDGKGVLKAVFVHWTASTGRFLAREQNLAFKKRFSERFGFNPLGLSEKAKPEQLKSAGSGGFPAPPQQP